MTPSQLNRLVTAAYMAKDATDRALDQASLETAYQAVTHFALVAVETPSVVQDAAKLSYPDIPVLNGLLRELAYRTSSIAAMAEQARMAAAS